MPFSSAAVSPSQTQPSPARGDEGQEEIEYESEYEEIEEEIEVEEEVEVEEEEEEQVGEGNEEDGDESEIGEDLTPVREENNLDDTDEDMDLEQDEEHLNSGPSTMRMSMVNPHVDISTNQEFCGDFLSSERREGGQSEELCTNEKITFTGTDAKASLDGKMEVSDINNKTFWSKGNVTLPITDACSQKDSGVGSAVTKSLHTDVEAVKAMEEMPSRMRAPPITPRDSSYGPEFDVGNKRQKIVCEFHAKGWCIRGKSCKFLHIKEGSDAAGQKSEFLDFKASSSVHMLPPQSRDNPVNCQIEKSVIHKPDMLDGAHEQAGNVPAGQNSCSGDFSRYTSPPVKCHSIDVNRALHGNFSGVLCDTYNKSRPSVPFGSSSWTTNALGTWNTPESNHEYRASISSSFRKSPSPLSGSNSGSNNLTNTQPTKYKTKISPDGWEPSVPFRPSHVITQNLFLKENPYDSILDGVEQTGAKDLPFEFSYSDPGVSVNNAHFPSNKLQKDKLLEATHVEDTRKSSRLSSSRDNGLKLDEPIHQKEQQMNGCGQKYENGIDIKRDENTLNESKALKYFHAALVEYVKELVKPSWREGLMSKDAHKIIVKRAVEKVLSTVQPDQIPNTAESIKSYLSISQVKLSKLVEGYIEKYGKS
ncbi:protein FRIGIDA-ESSENTIAL 1-like isoform X2 [Henckelia pumila]|uniref:protein FRIGIDA-ESSENTIAL 1-like isoform X2 n=1 Tax=Henckelia pumila TaxID=405737 RepID=UPI003C6DE930